MKIGPKLTLPCTPSSAHHTERAVNTPDLLSTTDPGPVYPACRLCGSGILPEVAESSGSLDGTGRLRGFASATILLAPVSKSRQALWLGSSHVMVSAGPAPAAPSLSVSAEQEWVNCELVQGLKRGLDGLEASVNQFGASRCSDLLSELSSLLKSPSPSARDAAACLPVPVLWFCSGPGRKSPEQVAGLGWYEVEEAALRQWWHFNTAYANVFCRLPL